MPDATTQPARAAMLGRIREMTGENGPAAIVMREWEGLPRGYTVASTAEREQVLQLLLNRLHDYGAQVYRIAPEAIASTVRGIVSALGLTEVLIPAGLQKAWLGEGHAFVEDEGFVPHALDRFSAVLTASTLAIAETGTLVLQNLPGQGRRAATLVPDVHLCVVQASDVVATVPEAVRLLQHTADLPTTFVSGPSATADIEMTRIKGVHGPRDLHVLLVDAPKDLRAAPVSIES